MNERRDKQKMGKGNPQESATALSDRSATLTSPGVAKSLTPGFRGKWMIWIVLLASLLTTYYLWHLARSMTLKRAQDRFAFRVETIESDILERLRAYEFLLRGGVGLFVSSEEVTRTEWRTYVANLEIDRYYPGIQGLGFSKRILPSEKAAHIRRIRGEGFPKYDIKPDGERPEYTSIVFLEPFDWRNQRAFGYDMFSEPTRKEAITRARDTGLAAMSGRVILVQETDRDVQAGFLMYLPVYRKGELQETPEQRREALTGYVYAPFRMNDFMRGVLVENQGYVELQVFDGDYPLKETLLYQSDKAEINISRSDHTHFATHRSILEYAGHRWLLVFDSSEYFDKTVDTGTINTILLLGIIISLLLVAVVSALTRSRNQAISLTSLSMDLETVNIGLQEEIGQRKRTEDKLRQSEMRIRESKELLDVVLANTSMMVVYLDARFNFIWVNRAYADTCKQDPSFFPGKNHFSLYPNEENQAIFRQVVDTGEPFIVVAKPFEFPDQPERGVTYWDWSLIPVKDDTGKITGLVFSLAEVTERIRATEELRENEEKFRAMFGRHQAIMLLVEPESGQIVNANRSAENFYGYTIDKLRTMQIHEINLLPQGDIAAEIKRAMDQERNYFVFPHRLASGETRMVEVHSSLLVVREKQLLFSIIHDITERTLGEEKIKASLREKEVLLRELYHRTKNNMQVIIGFLNLQSAKIKDEKILEMFKDTTNRIKSMALVHQKLYQAKNLSQIDLKDYIEDLAGMIMESSNKRPEAISIQMDLESVFVTIDTATPCGLIINELIFNAINHAFPGAREGEIGVVLRKRADGDIEIEVKDNGVGLPEGMDIRKCDSLGLESVVQLTEHQLRGQLEVRKEKGTQFRILFRETENKERV